MLQAAEQPLVTDHSCSAVCKPIAQLPLHRRRELDVRQAGSCAAQGFTLACSMQQYQLHAEADTTAFHSTACTPSRTAECVQIPGSEPEDRRAVPVHQQLDQDNAANHHPSVLGAPRSMAGLLQQPVQSKASFTHLAAGSSPAVWGHACASALCHRQQCNLQCPLLNRALDTAALHQSIRYQALTRPASWLRCGCSCWTCTF